ncbi:MAG TPA: acyl-CoA dehydrogenase family protein [Candidatus Dormibacteraeota bacterium]|nr:acyl-CoA dehydrogenase family protein [Candidatus Dormibacteraeota bacterium]
MPQTELQADTSEQDQQAIRQSVRELCRDFPDAYWRKIDKVEEYPEEFVRVLTKSGYLAALIPEEYGGAGMGITEAGIILEEINRAGANSGACHAQMYTMGALLRHGSEEQKRRWLPAIAAGELRLQSFGVTEPDAGSDTTAISTFAELVGDRYVVRGRKVFISRVQHSELLMLLCRTTALEQVKRKTDGLSVLLVDLRQAGDRLQVRPIRTMVNHETNELVFDGVEVPVENRIGDEGRGFRYILSGMNAERVLIASESLGDGRYFVERASRYASERVVFGRPIGQNQAVQFPIARAHVSVEAATLMRDEAARRFDSGEEAGAEANMAKLLASEAAWEAANAAMTAFGGYGLAVEYDIERKFREARLPIVAPVSNNLILGYVGEHVLRMPRSY